MKKPVLLILFFCFLGLGLSAQQFDGRYANATNLNSDDIEVKQVVLSLNGTVYSGKWETALATGENESVSTLQGVVVDKQNLSLTFEKDGQPHTGQFISNGKGGYDLMLDGQALFAREGW